MKQQLATLATTLDRLRHVRRFSTWPCLHPQNVQEHSFRVALFAWVIGTELYEACGYVHAENAAVMGLVHDTGEAIIGDILHPVKHAAPELEAAVAVQEQLAVEQLAGSFKCARLWRDFFLTVEEPKTCEGALVVLCDVLDLYYYVHSEADLGNGQPLAAVEKETRMPVGDYLMKAADRYPEEGGRRWLRSWLGKTL